MIDCKSLSLPIGLDVEDVFDFGLMSAWLEAAHQ